MSFINLNERQARLENSAPPKSLRGPAPNGRSHAFVVLNILQKKPCQGHAFLATLVTKNEGHYCLTTEEQEKEKNVE